MHGPCGTMGGAPAGCAGDGAGAFGDCCPSAHCDAFALGGNAESYDWPDRPVTEWRAGSLQGGNSTARGAH